MTMSEEIPTVVAPQVLLGNHLKALKLPTFAREYEKVAMESAQDRADYPRYLLRLCELERIDRERRNVERRIRLARFPQTKIFDTFNGHPWRGGYAQSAETFLFSPAVLSDRKCGGRWMHRYAGFERDESLTRHPFELECHHIDESA